MDREVKHLKQSRISIIKVRWNSRRGPEFTWEREDQMQKKYPHLFTNSAPAAKVLAMDVLLDLCMAISVISISSDSSEDSVWTLAGRVILFDTIHTTILDTTLVITPPATQTDTPVIPTETPIIAPISTHPLGLYTSFSYDDTTNSDTPDTPPSPTHAIPHGRPYRYHLNGPVHMMTVRKRVRSLPTHRLVVRHSTDHSSSDSSSEVSSDFTFGCFTLILLQITNSLSPVRADLIPSPKRVRDSGYLADVEVDPRETSLRDDVIVRVSDETNLEQDIESRDSGGDLCDQDEIETGVRGLVEVRVKRVTHPAMPEDIPEPAQEGAIERGAGKWIVRMSRQLSALTKRIAELERDNKRLRGTMSVESQRVDRLQRGMSRMQRELRQMRQLQFYDRVRVGRLEACARKHMGYRP
ncbi:hypothetical protein Tco_0478733 [Tanacetum coccineum]